MPVTTIDATPALIVVDLQKGVTSIPTAHPMDDVVQRSARLAAAFRGHGLPVVLVNVSGGAPGRTEAGASRLGSSPLPPDWADIVDELDPQPGDLRVTKQTWGAFHGTTLDGQLKDLGVTQVVLTGVATSAGVESTARSAYEHGYHVVLATDAMTDRSADAHANSVELIFPRLGETATTAEILELLEGRRELR
jgi:nicotinamidase-related amidase